MALFYPLSYHIMRQNFGLIHNKIKFPSPSQQNQKAFITYPPRVTPYTSSLISQIIPTCRPHIHPDSLHHQSRRPSASGPTCRNGKPSSPSWQCRVVNFYLPYPIPVTTSQKLS